MHRHMSWRRAITEGGVIVVSILLAFAIDAAWDDRQDRIAAARLVIAVAEELESNVAHFAGLRVRTARMSTAGLELLNETGPGSSAEPRWVMERITSIWGSPDVDPTTVALTAALESGTIGQIVGPELRERLQLLPRRYAELDRISNTLEEQSNQYFRSRLWAFVPQMNIEIESGFGGMPELWAEFRDGVPDASRFDADIEGLLGDLVFENAVVNRTTMSMILRRVSAALEVELQELSGELRRLAES